MKILSAALCLAFSFSALAFDSYSFTGKTITFDRDHVIHAGNKDAVLTGANGSVRSCWLKLSQASDYTRNMINFESPIYVSSETVQTAMLELGIEIEYMEVALNLDNVAILCNGQYGVYKSLNNEDILAALNTAGISLK